MEIEVLYEDASILVVYKPAGVATQTSRLGQKDMESYLKNYRAKKGEPPYIGVIHRLDQPVEGIMVFAKDQKSAAALSQQVQSRSIGKYYYAVTDTIPEATAGTLTDYLTFNGRTNLAAISSKEDPNAKKAELAYEVLTYANGHGLVNVSLKTGRHHQIRIQMAHMGCPLAGDGKYGHTENGRTANLGLCAYLIAFEHPVTKKKIEFKITPKGKAFEGFSF